MLFLPHGNGNEPARGCLALPGIADDKGAVPGVEKYVPFGNEADVKEKV